MNVIINLISDTLINLSSYMINALYIIVFMDNLHDDMGFIQSLMSFVHILNNLADANLINVKSIKTIYLINNMTVVISF